MREGDAEQNPFQLCLGMMKAVIVMICFKEIYYIFVGIVQEFLNSILNTMQIQGTNLSEVLTGNMGGGIFTAVACLVLLVVWLILICQFIMKRNRNINNETRHSIRIYWLTKFRRRSFS